MPELWVTDFTYQGWPDKTDIIARATDGQNGPPFNGKATLAMRVNDDRNSDQPLVDGANNACEAEFVAGKWEARGWEFAPHLQQGFNTLVLQYNGKKIPRTFRARNSGNPSTPATTQRPAQREAPIEIHLRTDPPQEVRDADGKLTGYMIKGYAAANKGREQYSDQPVEFLANGEVAPDCPRKLVSGKASYVLTVLPAGLLHFGVRIVGTNIEDIRWDIPVPPENPKNNTPVAKHVQAFHKSSEPVTAGGKAVVRHTVRLLVTDQQRKGVGNITLFYPGGNGNDATTISSDNAADRGWADCVVDVSSPKGIKFQAEAKAEALVSNVLDLDGPEPKKEQKVKTLTASCDRGTKVADDTMRFSIDLWALDENGNPVGGKRPTWKTDGNETPTTGITAADTGIVSNFVDIVGVGLTVDYQAFIRQDGAASNTLTLRGVKKPEQHTYAIEADLDTPHPVGGKFIVVGSTKVDNKLGSVTCTVSSSPDAIAGIETRLGKIEPGRDPYTYKLTSNGGKFKLAVPAASITSDFIELDITAPDGTSVTVPMVKPE